MFPGMRERLDKEFGAMAPALRKVKVFFPQGEEVCGVCRRIDSSTKHPDFCLSAGQITKLYLKNVHHLQ